MNSSKSNDQRAKILYALCADDGKRSGYNVGGLESATVYAIDHDGLRAVVSDTASPRLRPERRNITTHQSVLHHLMEEKTVLPMRFGVIARNADAVRALLKTNKHRIKEQLERVNGRVEMGLRVSWDIANIYEYFIATHPVLRQARDEILSRTDNVRREQKIDLGRLYESLRNAERKECTEKVTEVLFDYCVEIIENPVKKEKEVMNLACLVDRKKLDEFARGVFAASKRFDNTFLFDYSGPWAPHNFVTLDLRPPTAKAKVRPSETTHPD